MPRTAGCSSNSSAAFRRAERDDAVRVVILAGAGPVFSAGHDLGSGLALRERDPGPGQHVSWAQDGGTRLGTEIAHAPGMAPLLPEHTAVAQPA